MKLRDIPNLISLARIALVLPLSWLFAEGRYIETLWLFAAAGISDGVDGFLARHYHWQSRLGAFLDPLGDKLLLVTTYLWLGVLAALPWWLVLLVVGRDLVIVVGSFFYHRLVESLEPAPTAISKANTLMQILLGLVGLLGLAGSAVPTTLLMALVAVVTLTTLWSGGDYVHYGMRRAGWLGRDKERGE